jgi:hypothetical protein
VQLGASADAYPQSTTLDEGRLFPRHVSWELDRTTLPHVVTERIMLGQQWFIALIVGFGLLLVGELWGAFLGAGPERLLLQALGLAVLVASARATFALGSLKGLQTPTDHVHAIGPLVAITVPAGAALAVDGGVGFTAAGLGLLGAVGIATSATVRRRLESVVPDVINQIAVVPVLHALITLGTAATLLAFLATIARIEVDVLPLLVGTTAGLGIAGLLLASITDRHSARTHTVLAATVTGGFPVVALLSAPPTVTPRWPLSIAGALALLGVGLAVSAAWILVWGSILHAGTAIGERFDTLGRQVNTERAAAFAYLAIVSSGTLLAVLLAVAVTCGWFVTTGRVGRLGPWVLTGVLFGTPLWILLGGVGYQFIRTIRVTVNFRRCPDGSHRLPGLPFEPQYPVHLLDVDGFYAAAYADPFTKRVIITPDTIAVLSPEELAVVIAHEESHLEHRGALLQMLFATLPLGALMGQNVVYSIYDFMERERTADDNAIDRANEAGEDGATALERALAVAEDEPSPDVAWLSFLPTAVTIPEQFQPSTVLDRLYLPLFGTFAGQVHPSTPARKARIRRHQDEES